MYGTVGTNLEVALGARFDVRGRTVFITGAARGIGAAVAARLHAKGANVALAGLEPELLSEQAERLGERAAAFEADVTDFEALERAVAATVERFGSLDVAIANAGIHCIGTLAGAPHQQIERVLEVNLQGVWRTDRAVLPHVIANRGYLLNIASLAAASHVPLMAPYAASKAGVEGLTDALRVELARSGARVGCAYFGIIDTDIARTTKGHASTQILEQLIPPFARRSAPLSAAVDAIERGVERRSSRVWAPRWVGPALVGRGVLQPLTEWRAMRSRRLTQALEVVATDASLADQDPTLGISGAARAGAGSENGRVPAGAER
jgi:NAD(P)-dependent dehydrogenase (short-subunit alcohol dehydrogenase family)